jgi:hypothetical protein
MNIIAASPTEVDALQDTLGNHIEIRMKLLTARASLGAMEPVCQMLFIVSRAGMQDKTIVPIAERASSSVGSSQTSVPIRA